MRSSPSSAAASASRPRGRRAAQPQALHRRPRGGLCHSDLSFAENDFGTVLPAVLGHELAGVVVALGPAATRVQVGDHVVGSLVRACGDCACAVTESTVRCRTACRSCAAGDRPVCSVWTGLLRYAALGTAAFASHALVHENQLVAVPRELPFAQAAILGCGVVTGAGAVLNTASVQPGESVAVLGLGGVGLNAVSGARIAGATTIVAVDRAPEKLELARRLGATDVVDASSADPVAAVRELTGGGVQHAFEVVGLEATTLQAVRMTAVGGTAYLVGLHKPGAVLGLDVMADLMVPQRSIVAVYMGSTDIHRDIPRYARLALDGELDLAALVAEEIALDDLDAGFDRMRTGRAARSVVTAF
ncbi:MAG: zinc-binding dehydrogenase [Candidatus Nanopelagicales bacterium]